MQAPSLQKLVISVSPQHWFPPLEASIDIDRARVFIPLPHVVVHVDHSDHDAQAQSTGSKKR